jgi:hypothetical protein
VLQPRLTTSLGPWLLNSESLRPCRIVDVLGFTTCLIVPQARFGCARGDNFVRCHHTERVHDAYAGERSNPL